MNREDMITKAMEIWWHHDQVRPPEGLCECGYLVPLGYPFSAHIFNEIFDAVEPGWVRAAQQLPTGQEA